MRDKLDKFSLDALANAAAGLKLHIAVEAA